MLLRGLADLAAAEGRPAQALRLAGAAERLVEAAGVPAGRLDLADAAGRLAACRAAVGEAAAAAAWAAGRALTPEQAVAEALADLEALAGETPATPPAAAGGAGALTAREAEVAALVARGLSNRQIAAELAISARTAERHLVNILDKLGFASRVQVATWAVDQGLAPPSRRAPA